MISVKNLSKRYGSITAVNNLNLDIRNELFVFLGPNGAGKTTSIKMMTGLLVPSSGSVFINGFDLLKDPINAKSSLGIVPEQVFLYDKLKGREFVEFIATIYRVPPQIARKRLAQLYEIFELEERIDDFIEDYSHGMKQKIALIAALAHDPSVLFLDEPTVGLDPKAVRNLRDLLRGLIKKGKTVFMSTHILEIAGNMCDRIGIIHKGELVALGTPDELKQTSKSGAASLEDIFLNLTDSGAVRGVDLFLQSE
ncbi:ABC transporter ATP-binding protein [candidate division KSB1 bacterium]|nr:ABC transporter ATP-binding protein [candidate division KSB1 bacterium]